MSPDMEEHTEMDAESKDGFKCLLAIWDSPVNCHGRELKKIMTHLTLQSGNRLRFNNMLCRRTMECTQKVERECFPGKSNIQCQSGPIGGESHKGDRKSRVTRSSIKANGMNTEVSI